MGSVIGWLGPAGTSPGRDRPWAGESWVVRMISVFYLATQVALAINIAESQNAFTPGSLAAPKKTHLIRIDGDIMIGGVFPVHEKTSNQSDGPCGKISEGRGLHRVEAMLFAIDYINNQTDILRGLTLGAVIMDSCSNPAFALNQSLDFVRDLIGATDHDNYKCRDGSSPMTSKKRDNVVAVVGGSYSSVTVQVANLLRLFGIVQVSPASTNADLSDKGRFEYFARTVPSDSYQVRAMVSIAKKFNWTYVSLLYSSDEYGELGAEAFKKEARKAGICLATEERVSISEEKLSQMKDSINNIVKKMQRDQRGLGAEVVVLFVNTEYIPQILKTTAEIMGLNRTNKPDKQIIWLASEAWDRKKPEYMVDENWRAAEGAMVLMLPFNRIPEFEKYYVNRHPNTSTTFQRNGWMRENWSYTRKCSFGTDWSPDNNNRCEDKEPETLESFRSDDKVQYTINAVMAIAHALDEYHKRQCNVTRKMENHWISRPADNDRMSSEIEQCASRIKDLGGTALYQEYLLKVNFTDMAGHPFSFSDKGDGPSIYTLLQYKPQRDENGNRNGSVDTEYEIIGNWTEEELVIDNNLLGWRDEKLPTSVCSKPCAINERREMINPDEQCCWACVKCADTEYLLNATTCMNCSFGMYPEADRTKCYNVSSRNVDYMMWNSPFAIVPTIIAVLGIVATLFVIVIYIRFNETPVVKASGRELSYIMLIAMLMCYMMTFILIGEPSTIRCAIKRTGIGLSFSLLYAAMFVKTNRIARIFSNATRSAARPVCISPMSQVGLTAILVGFQFFYSVVWLIVTPPATKYIYPEAHTAVLTCNVPDHHFLYSLAYVALLIIMCTVYAIKTRQVPENFNETKFIGFSMYTTCVLWVSWIFFFFGTSSDFKIQTTSLCMSISMSANVALACIFSPKVWIILFETHKNVRKPDGEYMLSKRSLNNNRANSTYGTTVDEPSQYTALLSEQRRRSSRRLSQPSTASSAQDTFL